MPLKSNIMVSSREYDGNGWYEIKNNPISKVGVFPYSGASIDPSLDPGKTYMVYRPAEELSHPECIASFKLLPWVDLHPNTLLGPEDAGRVPAEQKGIEGVIGESVYFKDDYLFGNLKLFSDNLGGKIEDGVRELSAGYGCTYELTPGVFNGQRYDAIQRNIRGNHLASVPEGRMGPDVAVLDHLTFTFDAKDIAMTEEEKKMKECADRAVKDGYKRYSKDADEEEKEKKEAEDKAAKDKMAKDAEEELKKKEADDKAAKDAEEKEKEEKEMKDKKGMDAAISGLRGELEVLKKDSIKAVLRETKSRDALASKLSNFVGVFDHSEMTTTEVAAYGVEKLGLKCAQGTEMAALDGYLHNRKPPTEEVGFALDTGSAASGDLSDLNKFYNTAA